MKNFFKLFGIIAIVAVIGFSFAACGGDDGGGGGGGGGALSGKYYFEYSTSLTSYYEFTGSDSWQLVIDGNFQRKGTYTVSDNTVTLNYLGSPIYTLTIVDSKTLRSSGGNTYIKK